MTLRPVVVLASDDAFEEMGPSTLTAAAFPVDVGDAVTVVEWCRVVVVVSSSWWPWWCAVAVSQTHGTVTVSLILSRFRWIGVFIPPFRLGLNAEFSLSARTATRSLRKPSFRHSSPQLDPDDPFVSLSPYPIFEASKFSSRN